MLNSHELNLGDGIEGGRMKGRGRGSKGKGGGEDERGHELQSSDDDINT
jgi:hypothetical protein